MTPRIKCNFKIFHMIFGFTWYCTHAELKLDSWSLEVGFIPIISTKEITQIKKGKL